MVFNIIAFEVSDILRLVLYYSNQACVQYILRLGIADQMGEPAQKEFTFLLTKEVDSYGPSFIHSVFHLCFMVWSLAALIWSVWRFVMDSVLICLLLCQLSGPENSSPRLIVVLRTIAYLLITLGEVPSWPSACFTHESVSWLTERCVAHFFVFRVEVVSAVQ